MIADIKQLESQATKQQEESSFILEILKREDDVGCAISFTDELFKHQPTDFQLPQVPGEMKLLFEVLFSFLIYIHSFILYTLI